MGQTSKINVNYFFQLKTERFNETGSHQPLSFVTRLSFRLKQKRRNYLSEGNKIVKR